MSGMLPASVHQRLQNCAKIHGLRCNDVLQRFALERWLYRLSFGPHAKCFVLKGALLLAVWDLPVTRATRDIDVLARLENDPGRVSQIVVEVCATPVEDDGLRLDDCFLRRKCVALPVERRVVRWSQLGLDGRCSGLRL